MSYTEQQFQTWASPPSDAEKQRCKNAVSSIKNALANHSVLATKLTKILVQGSYANNTNVRLNSDIDIAVICTESSTNSYTNGMSGKDFGLETADYQYPEFRRHVIEALNGYFGHNSVKP